MVKQSKKYTTIILVILIHGCIIVPILFITLDLALPEYASREQTPIIIAYDPPAQQPVQQHIQQPPDEPEKQEKKPDLKEQNKKITRAPRFLQSSAGQKDNATAHAQATQKPISAPLAQKEPAPEQQQPAAPRKKELQQSQDAIDSILDAQGLLALREAQKQEEEQKEIEEQRKETGEQTPKQLLTLADLMQGFLSQKPEEGDNGKYGNAMLNNGRRGHVSEEQLKHERYTQKILQCIANSYKIHRYKIPRIPFQQPIVIMIAINADGTLYDTTLLQSSGNFMIDNFARFLFNDASGSFPPIPKSFNTDVYQSHAFTFNSFYDFEEIHRWSYHE